MALERSLVTIPLAQGLDTKSDPRQLPPGKLTTLQNGVFTTGGKLRKRYGTSVLGTSIFGAGTISSADSLTTLGDSLLLSSAGTLYAWSPSESKWTSQSTPQAVRRTAISQDPIQRLGYDIFESSIATHSSGVTCVAYTAKVGTATFSARYALIDAATGQVFTTAEITTGASIGVKVAVLGARFVIVYGTTAAVSYFTVTTAGSASGTTSLVSGMTLGGHAGFDLLTNAAGTRCYLAFPTVAGTDLTIKYLDASYVLTGSVNVGLALGANWVDQVALCEDTSQAGNIMALTASNLPAVYLSVVSTALAVVTAKQTADGTPGGLVDSIGLALQPTLNRPQGYISVSKSVADFGSVSTVRIASMNATTYTPISSGDIFYNYRMVSKPFAYADTILVGVGVFRGGSSRYFCDFTGKPVAKFATVAGGSGAPFYPIWPNGQNIIPQPALQPSGAYGAPCSVAYAARAQSGAIVTSFGLDLVQLSFPTTPVQTAELAGSLHLANGIQLSFDGVRVSETGFNYDPFMMVATGSGAGGTIPAGTYGYCCVFEWTDGTGAVHHSAPSPVVSTVLTGATSSVAIKVPTYANTLKQANYAEDIKIAIYRTIANGSVYYRLTGVVDVMTALSTTFTDDGTVTDAVLQGNATLYTMGGVLESIAPPAFSAMTVYRNRLIGITAEKPGQFWYSKQVVSGQPVEFSDFLTQDIDPTGGGACTALAALDDKLLIFKPGVVYYMTGTGPDATGGQNDFSVPVLINTNSGCIEPRSVITAADGCLYQSAKGWFILDRSLNDDYIGAPVEAFNSATARSATIIPSTNEVRFVLSTGTVLVYDFLYKQWSTFTGLAAVDSTIWNGVCHTVTSGGLVSYENPATFTDNGTVIELRLSTGWLGAGDLQSFLRIYKLMVLGTWKSSHVLNVWVQYDYRTDTATANKYAITASSDPSPVQFQYRINLAQQKAEAVMLTIFDSSITGESLDMSAISFEVGRKSGPMKLPAAGNV